MSITKKRVMTVYSWPSMGLFLALALLFVSIQTQEAYAERKKVSGTCKVLTQLTRVSIPCGGPGAFVPLWAWHLMLNSDDPDWNNVQRFSFQYDDITKERFFRGFGVNTHPNGDQTFFQYKGKREPIGTGPYDYTWKIEGFFIKGTGKFKGIKGSMVANGKTSMAEKTWEWEAEYEVR
ncbi:hypothetical protein D1BOALGB6SA_3926 [Olavius sp. associated proteobacterium Delta 1]|nr:hypothetical protein D1BOALGB6SA_3926 [Olavius sp. associated proteobacterium Delta 1]